MIQDIFPSKLDNVFRKINPESNDSVLIFNDEGKAYVGDRNGKMEFLKASDIQNAECVYLFIAEAMRIMLLLRDFQK